MDIPLILWPDWALRAFITADIDSARNLASAAIDISAADDSIATEGLVAVGLLNAEMIYSKNVISAAVTRAIRDHIDNCRLTNSLSSELVVAFSPTENINKAFERFGPGNAQKGVIVLLCSRNSQKIDDLLAQHPIKNVERVSDVSIKKYRSTVAICKVCYHCS